MTIGDEKVRRYEPRMIGIEDRPHEAGMYVSLHGHYVLHSAYAELAAERDALERALSHRNESLRHSNQEYTSISAQRDAAEAQLAALRGKLRGLADEWEEGTENRENETGYVRGADFTFAKCANELRTLTAADGG